MHFEACRENSDLIKRLEDVIRNDRISHAYILEGSSCVDKKVFAESFVKGILCGTGRGDGCGQCSICSKVDHGNHEDIMYLSADGGSVKDAAVIRMQEKLKTRPLGDRHIVIIEDSDTMTRRAQNRLLKTLEEPPGRSVIMLLSENMENLLPTVQSRCVKYRINSFRCDHDDSMLEKARRIADMTLQGEPFYRVKKEIDGFAGNRESAAAFLDALQMVYRNIIIEKKRGISLYRDADLMERIHDVETARKQIRSGVSPHFAVKNLLLKIGG